MATRQLTADDWIKAGFRALSTHGTGALKAEKLAKTLRATKGSFYWHFKDVPDFHHKMIEAWVHAGTTAIIQAVGPDRKGRDALHKLFQEIGMVMAKNPYGGPQTEPAIREWAKTNKLVCDNMNKVDDLRMNYVRSLLQADGQSAVTAENNARLLYAAVLGFESLASSRKVNVSADLLRLLEKLLD
jgi:AcrR family transcriptional regulator